MKLHSASSGWEKVAVSSAKNQIPASKILFRQGDLPQSVILLESGWVKLVRLEADAREQLSALCPPGSPLGASEVIGGQAYPATAVALSSCRLRPITASVFLDRVGSDPEFSKRILQAIGRQNYAREILSSQLKSISPRLRLEQLFWRLLRVQKRNDATETGMRKGTKLLVPLQYQELAQMISVTPEHFSRLLKAMEKDGVLRRDHSWLTFPKPNQLWRAPEIESLVESEPRQSNKFPIADLILT